MIDFDAVTQLAHEAGLAIMEVYDRAGDINVEIKGDESPLTEADLAANDVITRTILPTPRNSHCIRRGQFGDLGKHRGWSILSTEPRSSSRGTDVHRQHRVDEKERKQVVPSIRRCPCTGVRHNLERRHDCPRRENGSRRARGY